MAVPDRDMDRAMAYAREDINWFWAVMEMLRGDAERVAPTPAPRLPRPGSGQHERPR